MDIEPYDGREQTAAKHLILGSYLESLAFKVGQFGKDLTFNYVDGFSGPWESKASDLSDTSPALALQRLVAVRQQLAARGRSFTVRAFFVSRTKSGADQLDSLRARFPEAEIEIVIGAFEERIDEARCFARSGRDPFAFLFIDPTGWTGFGLRAITPLLREGRTKVLLNFMTGHVSRFIDKGPPNVGPSFVDLFGDASFRDAWRGITGLDREERMVETYSARLAQAGQYRHCVSAVILNPTADRAHYHLVYGTHSDAGLLAFREAERRGVGFQRAQRAEALERKKVKQSGQLGLFGGSKLVARSYEDELRDRYLPRAFARLDEMLDARSDVPWDDLVIEALRVPMIAEADVKDWVGQRQSQGRVEVVGLAPRARVPQWQGNHRVRRIP